jgi:phage head maturation protease
VLLGSLPLGHDVELGKGRWLRLSPERLEQWAAPGMLTPVLVGHDADRLLGWCDKVTLHRDRAMLFGELDGGLPDARGVARLVRAHAMDGLSPGVKVTRGTVYRPAVGKWGEGDVVDFPELSVVWQPRVPDARWLGL